MHVPVFVDDGLYHKHGEPVLSKRQSSADLNIEQVVVNAHPFPVVLQPAKYVLQAESDVAVVLSVHYIGLQTEFDQMQTF